MEKMPYVERIRNQPKVWDYCYIVCRKNKEGIKFLENKFQHKKINILDVGCGTKPFKSSFRYAKKYIGIDFSKEGTDADIIVDINTQKIPFKNDCFDLVIISESMEHIYNNENLTSEIKRVVKKEGYLYISAPLNCAEHGIPYDFYRFTKYFYFKKFSDFKLIKYGSSNTNITTPLVLANQIIIQISKLAKIIIVPINIIIRLIDGTLSLISNKRIKKFLDQNPGGYYFIFKK